MSPDEVHEVRIRRLEQDVRDLRADLEKSRDGVRTLIMVLVGFAFTVAASAVALAFSLGGPS